MPTNNRDMADLKVRSRVRTETRSRTPPRSGLTKMSKLQSRKLTASLRAITAAEPQIRARLFQMRQPPPERRAQ